MREKIKRKFVCLYLFPNNNNFILKPQNIWKHDPHYQTGTTL